VGDAKGSALRFGLKHEVFRLLADAYPNASEPRQTRLLDRAVLGPQGEDAQGLEESTRQYAAYNLLYWLHRVAPGSTLTIRQFEEVQQAHEGEFEPREHPDLDSYTTRLVATGSPVTVDELLAEDPAELIGRLLSYQGDSGMERITRGRLLETAAQAVARSYPYGQRLSAALQEREVWDSDLWESIIEGWREAGLTEQQWEEVLDFLVGHPELYSFANEIADLLEKSSREDGDGVIPSSSLSSAEALAEQLWETLRDSSADAGLNGTEGWLFKAINHPGGKLIEFWLLTLSRKRAEADEDWHGLPPEHRRYFDKVLSGESYAAELGRVVLASQLFFLFSSDAGWARQNILPLLDWSVDARRADQPWHGFLSRGKWSEALLPDLIPLYEGAFAHVSDLPQRLRRQFSNHLASIAVYGSSNPVQEGWLGRFLHAVESEDRAAWASEVGLILRQLEGEAVRDIWDGWLGEYWSRRNAGIPLQLDPDELEEMIYWSLRLGPAFPEVVQRTSESAQSTIKYSRRFLPQLAKSGYASRYPEAVAELLRYLLPYATQPFLHCDQVATLFHELVRHTSVTRTVLDQICNELGSLGCPNAAALRGLLQ
jgi:hypothetical protein